MADLKSILLNLMSEDCYEVYFSEKNFFDVQCFKALLSKGLGIGIVAGSILVKIPQIMKILSNKSADGINLFSVLLDLTAITFPMAYSYVSGFPFSAWGDAIFLAIQTAVIAALILHYAGSNIKSILFVLFYGSVCYGLMCGLTPLKYLWGAQCCSIPFLLVGKLSQARTNYKSQSTGQLSAVTCFMLFGGSLARIFTSIQETGDQILILTYCLSSFANGVIGTQFILYWKTPETKKVDRQQNKPQKLKSKKAD